MQTDYVSVNESGELVSSATKRAISKTKFSDDEVKECITKSEHVAKWFAKAGKVETIYITLGVRP